MDQRDISFPEHKLPQCWSDDVRMNALFAPFRIKSANPESWNMKMKFWTDMIKQWCHHKKDPIVSAADVKFAFQRKGRTPACIDIVVEELYRNNELAPVSKYLQTLNNGPEGWLHWSVRLAFNPAVYAATAFTSFLSKKQQLDSDGLPKASIDATHRFVVESVVKDQAMELLESFPAGEERKGTIDDLMKRCAWQQSREVFMILLGFLVMDGSAVKKGDIVKLAQPYKKVTPISEADEAFVRLLSAESKFEIESVRLRKEVGAAEAEAKAALKLGNKVAAKGHLRRKHRIQQNLNRCEAALENVRQLLHQAEEVNVNADILDTYKTSSKAMKTTMSNAGLSEDNVLDTMDELKEVMDSYNEVEKALSTTVIDDVDQSELEEELRELLSGPGGPNGGTPQKIDKREDGDKRRSDVPSLPSPPASLPKPRKADREYVFDGEARMLAELNDLSDKDISMRGAGSSKNEKPKEQTGRPWYGSDKSAENVWCNSELNSSVDKIADGYAEVIQDERLHPGQPLNLDYSTPPRLYNKEFQVQDHKPSSGAEIYNSGDNTGLSHNTEYTSIFKSGKLGDPFQMTPGGERKRSTQVEQDSVEDLERRLKDLRGLTS